MDPQPKKELILSLIRDDLLHQRLIQGLHALGFEADDYGLHLGTTILGLMGYDETRRTDALYNCYYGLAARAQYADAARLKAALGDLAAEIYGILENAP